MANILLVASLHHHHYYRCISPIMWRHLLLLVRLYSMDTDSWFSEEKGFLQWTLGLYYIHCQQVYGDSLLSSGVSLRSSKTPFSSGCESKWLIWFPKHGHKYCWHLHDSSLRQTCDFSYIRFINRACIQHYAVFENWFSPLLYCLAQLQCLAGPCC